MIRRTLNTKFLAFLFFGTIGLAVGAFFLHRYMTVRSADKLLQRAEVAEKKDELSEALEYYKRYLAYKPSDTKQLAEFGLLLVRYGEKLIDDQNEANAVRLSALPVFERFLQRESAGQQADDIRNALVTLVIATAKLPDQFVVAEPHVQRLIEDAKREHDRDPSLENAKKLAALYGQLGMIYAGQTKYESKVGKVEGAMPDAAIWAFEDSIKLDPNNVNYYLPLANAYRETDAADAGKKADAVMKDLVDFNPKDPTAYLARTTYRLKNNNIPGAKEDADQALLLSVREPNVDILLAAALVELAVPNLGGDLKAARGYLQKAIETSPTGRIELYLALADLEQRSGNADAAEKVLADGVEKNPKSVDLAYVLANIYVDDKKPAKAKSIATRLRGEPIQRAPLDLLDARITVAEGMWKEGLAQLEAIRPSLEGDTYPKLLRITADMDIARCYRELDRPKDPLKRNELSDAEKEIAAYRRILATDENYLPAQLGLVTALLREGAEGSDETARTDRSAEAMRILQGASTTSLEARMYQVRLLANQALRQDAAQRNWAPVRQAIDALERDFPNQTNVTVAVTMMRAEMDVAEGRLAEGRKRMADARAANIEEIAFWVAEIQFDQRIKQYNDALKLLDEADRKFGPKAELFVMRTQFWLNRNDERARAAIINMIPRIKTLPAERQNAFSEYLSRALARVDAPKEALSLAQTVVAKDDDKLRPLINQFDMAVRAGEFPLARATVDNIRRLDGDKGTQWRYAESALIIAEARKSKDLSKLPIAKSRIQEIRDESNRATMPRLSVLEADIARLEGDTERAIECLRRAIDEGEQHTAIVRELVQLYYSEKKYDEADQLIKDLERKGALESSLKRLATQVSLGLDDKEKALELASEAVSPESNDYRDQIWLGQVYAAAKDSKAAETAFEKAVKLAPTSTDAWLAYIQFQTRAGLRAEAEKTITRAKAALPPETAALALAKAYQIVGRNDLAQELFEKAIAAAKPGETNAARAAAGFFLNQGRFDRAEPLLKSLSGENASSGDRAWARRALAVGIYESGLVDRVKEALDLVEANLKDTPDSYEDQSTRAILLTAFPDRRKEAITALESLGTQAGAKNLAAKLILAQLYDTEGNWAKSRELYEEAIKANPDSPRHLVAYLKALVQHEEFDEAEKRIKDLEKAGFTSINLLTIQSELRKKRGQTDQAIQDVRAYAEKHPNQPVAVAELLERLGDTATAETLLKQHADDKDHPEYKLALARFYGRQNRPEEAIDLCDAARQSKIPFEIILAAAYTALSVSQPSPELVQRIETWINEAEQTAGKDKFLSQRGLLLSLAGRHKEAEDLYRKAIAGNSADVMSLNNLAWLLAQTGGDAEEALRLIDRAIGVVGFNHALLDTRAMVQLARQQPRLALADINRVIETRKEGSYFFHLARAQFAAGNTAAAAAALKSAHTLGLKPTDVDPLERNNYTTLVAELQKATTEEAKK